MRREPVIVALLLAVACLAVSPSASAQSKKKEPFSGCEKGAHLGKVLITVEEVNENCRVTAVTPASVCVAPNGAIRWQVEVEPECEVDGEPEPAIEITTPRYKLLDPEGKPPDEAVLEDSCRKRFDNIKAAGPNILFCDISEDAKDGFYKYDLTSTHIQGVDPGIEVRGPRAP